MLSQQLTSPFPPRRKNREGNPRFLRAEPTLGAFILEGSPISGRGEGTHQDAEVEENLFPCLTQ